MLEDSTRTAIINKEIETYRKFAVALESLKTVVHTFDGKCFNKNFTKALDDYLKYGKADRSYHVSAGINNTSFGDFFDINIRCFDDMIKCETQGSYFQRINNSNCSLRINADDATTKTKSGKYRIKASGIIESFDEKIRYLNDKAVELENGLREVEAMRADMEHIKQLMKSFEGKYHARIKDVFNCDYKLKNDSGMQYR